jgi:hypothetical protein
LYILCIFSPLLAEDFKIDKLSDNDYTALKICEGVIQLFKQFPDSVWPGFNLAQRPFIFYMPEKWVLLFNYPKETEGFTSYPADWPDLGTNAQFHPGKYKDLAGQLAFDFQIDTIDVAAVPYSEKPAVELFAFLVHENFHEYQQYGKHPTFGIIPWEREELYPIQDAENTALAYLEMKLLMEALKMVKAGNEEKCREYVKQFVAIRDQRWKQSDPFVARYEQGQEINEGTAKYAELKSIALMKQLKYKSSLRHLTGSLLKDFSSISMPAYLLKDFQERMRGNSVSPEDMLRNRIYPVGSAQGFLLDYFKINWKSKAQKAGPEFTYAQLFRSYLRINERELESLLVRAKNKFGYEKTLTSAKKLILEYQNGFNKELMSFESQTGYRMEIDLFFQNMSRSRSSSARSWIMDKGTRELRSRYDVYVLENNNLFFELHDTGLYEENDWNLKKKKIVFFVPEITSISLDGKPFEPVELSLYQFKNLEIVGKNFKLNYSKPGYFGVVGQRIKIQLVQ